MLLGAWQTLVAAQAAFATLSGNVRDASTGAPLAGAIVEVVALHRVTLTDAAGRYELARLPGGTHRIAVRYLGYTQHELQAVVPSEGRLDLSVALEPEPLVLPPIEVSATPSNSIARPRSAGRPEMALGIRDIREHPQLSEPDALQALRSGAVALPTEGAGGLNVRGGAADQTAYVVDGIPVFNPYHSAGLSSAWNPDVLESLTLTTPASSVMPAGAVSGTLEAWTRTPGSRLSMLGGVSSSQVRAAADGPIGHAGGGFVLGLRSGLPDLIAPDDPDYLRGASHDWLAKLEFPVLRGTLRLVGVGNGDGFDATAWAEGNAPIGATTVPRHRFSWGGRSIGASWTRLGSGGMELSARVWNATTQARAGWLGSTPTDLSASRSDVGLLVNAGRRSEHSATSIGLKLEHVATRYLAESAGAAAATLALAGRTPIATLFGQHARPLGSGVSVELGGSLALMDGRVFSDPRVSVAWQPRASLTLTGSYARTHQFVQSLRNTESLVGSVFPAELYVTAGSPGVPVLQGDLGVLALAFRPAPALHLRAQAWTRRDEGLVLTAARQGAPFAQRAVTTGSGNASGAALDAIWTSSRARFLVSYGLQDVRLRADAVAYTPTYGVSHRLEAGVTVFPLRTFSVRLGALSELGRRTTPLVGGFDWESCNLLDRGCEFGGSPEHDPQALGGVALPAYLRLDLGVRKEWAVAVRGAATTFGVYSTLTNVLGRGNVLTYVNDPGTGALNARDMRPRAPLVIGFDWRF